MSDRPEKNLFNHAKLRLAAPNPAQPKGKWANLMIDVWNNNPRFILQTNDPSMSSKNYGKFTAPIETPTFLAIVELIDGAIKNKEQNKKFVEVFSKPKGSDMSTPPVHICDIVIGRDAEGCVFIALAIKEEGWPSIKFVFSQPDQRFTKIKHGDGAPLTKAENSELFAIAYKNLMRLGVMSVLSTHFVEAQRPGGNGGGGGSYGGQRPQQGGYQVKSQQSYTPARQAEELQEADLPF